MLVSIADQTGQNKSIQQGRLGTYPYQHHIRNSEPTPCTARPCRKRCRCPGRCSNASPMTLEAALAGLRALRARWQHSAAQWRAERELEAAIEMGDSTLNDIGAPDWLRARAAARRESQLQRLDILRSNYW